MNHLDLRRRIGVAARRAAAAAAAAGDYRQYLKLYSWD
jgi:hypothetical protein